MYTLQQQKIKSLPKLTTLQLQLNIGTIDHRYGRISDEELNNLHLKLHRYLNNEHSIQIR